MKSLVFLIGLASAAVLAFGQQNKSSASAPVDEQAARRAVDAGHAAFVAAMRASDANALAKLVATDALLTPPNSAPLKGPEAVRRYFAASYEVMKTTSASVADRKVTILADRAIEEGEFSLTLSPKDGGASVEDRGRFLAIWERQSDGAWKVTRDIWNSSLPLPATANAGGAASILIGTYRLVSRKLPSGEVLTPPKVNGLNSITPTTMNFNIVIGDTSFSSFGTYRLTGSTLEQTIFFDHGVEKGKNILFQGTPHTVKVPLKFHGGRVELKTPKVKALDGTEIDPPTEVFDGKSLVATKPGEFVDVWEKISEK